MSGRYGIFTDTHDCVCVCLSPMAWDIDGHVGYLYGCPRGHPRSMASCTPFTW